MMIQYVLRKKDESRVSCPFFAACILILLFVLNAHQERVIHDVKLRKEVGIFLHLHHEGRLLHSKVQLYFVNNEIHIF